MWILLKSGHVHVIGFLISHVESSFIKHTRGKRHQVGLVGCEEHLLPPYAKPTDWESSAPRQSGTTQHNWIGEGARSFLRNTPSDDIAAAQPEEPGMSAPQDSDIVLTDVSFGDFEPDWELL